MPAPLPSTQPDRAVLAGTVERVTFHNAESGFLRAVHHMPEARYFSMPSMELGAEVRMKRALNCWPWVQSLTHSPEAVIPFAGGNRRRVANDGDEIAMRPCLVIRGIGPVYAKKMVKAFGEAVFDVIEAELRNMTDSQQQRQHWLAEQVLGWSDLPVVHVRPTVFLEHFFFSTWAASSIAKDGTIRLPFGSGRTSPVAVRDVAAVVAAVLESPLPHTGKIYELTGPRSQDMASMAAEYSAALGRPVAYVDVPLDDWRDQELRSRGLPDHVVDHFVTMARLHAENRYDRMTHDVEAITGRPALPIRSYVESRADLSG